MKKSSMLFVILVVLLGTLSASACSTVAAEPVQALAATEAPVVIVTDPATEVVAPSALPTDTVVPASPTASRIEFPVSNARLEVKIIDVEKPYRVDLGIDPTLGTPLTFTAGPGNMFLGLGIRVKNLSGSDITFKWTDIYLTNKYGEKWYPTWGAYQDTNAAMDPLTVEIVKYDQVHPDFDPDAHFYASDNGFARVIFRIPRDNLYYFLGFSDLPLIEINWRYY